MAREVHSDLDCHPCRRVHTRGSEEEGSQAAGTECADREDAVYNFVYLQYRKRTTQDPGQHFCPLKCPRPCARRKQSLSTAAGGCPNPHRALAVPKRRKRGMSQVAFGPPGWEADDSMFCGVSVLPLFVASLPHHCIPKLQMRKPN